MTEPTSEPEYRRLTLTEIRLREWVKAFVAVSVTLTILTVSYRHPENEDHHIRLSSAWFLMVGYYFGQRERRDR